MSQARLSAPAEVPTLFATRTRWLNTLGTLNASLPRSRSMTASEVLHVQTFLDTETDGVLHLLSALYERRNGYASISRLPSEVLAHTFSFLVDVDPPRFPIHTSTIHPPTLGWIAVSRVSRRWRTVALGWPALWTRLSMDECQPWGIFLQRAKNAPIFINGTNSDNHASSRIPLILNHQYHLRELCLSHLSIKVFVKILNGLTGPLPQLRVLSLRSSRSPGRVKLILPPNFLSNVVPSLEELVLANISFPWGIGSKTLNKLYSSQVPPTRPISSYTIFDVARTLQHTPALQSLLLTNVLPEPPTNIRHTNTNSISLPHLKELTLMSRSNSCWHLWSWMNAWAPATNIQCTGMTTDESLIVSMLQSHLAALPVFFTTTEIAIPSSTTKELSFTLKCAEWRAETNIERLNPDRGPYILSLMVSCASPVSLAQRLLDETSKEELTYVKLSGHFGDDECFYDTFLPMRKVDMLELCESDAGVALAALAQDRSSPESEDATLFPGLISLRCKSMNFSWDLCYRGRFLPMHTVMDMVFETRDDVDTLAIKYMRIEECDVFDEWVAQWQNNLVRLQWDFDEGALEDEEIDGSDGWGFLDFLFNDEAEDGSGIDEEPEFGPVDP